MIVITNVYDLIKSLNDNLDPIYLSYQLYDWLLLSNWNCVLGDNLKSYSINHKIIRVSNDKELKND